MRASEFRQCGASICIIFTIADSIDSWIFRREGERVKEAMGTGRSTREKGMKKYGMKMRLIKRWTQKKGKPTQIYPKKKQTEYFLAENKR